MGLDLMAEDCAGSVGRLDGFGWVKLAGRIG
jgi:hypothetical protein